MSTLISRLGRRFREKPKSTNLDFPALPTPREMLEDIEGCQSGDPIISLATIIQRKGKQSSLLDKDFLAETGQNGGNAENLGFLAPYRDFSAAGIGVTSPEKGEESGGSAVKRKGSFTGSLVTGKKGGADAENLQSYNKFKQFLLVCEKSEEILERLEPRFKVVENSLKEAATKRREERNVKAEERGQGDESEEEDDQHRRREISESDLCSSPLM